jgi:hypothetical protein
MRVSTISSVGAVSADEMNAWRDAIGCEIMREVTGVTIWAGTLRQVLLANGDLGWIMNEVT